MYKKKGYLCEKDEFEVIKDIDEKELTKARKFNRKYDEVKLNKMWNRLEKMNKVVDAMPVVGLILLFIGIIIFFTCGIQEDSISFPLFIVTCLSATCLVLILTSEQNKADYAWTVRMKIRNNKLLDTVENLKNIEILKLKISSDGCMVKYKKTDGVVEKEYMGWGIEEASVCNDIDKVQIYFKYDTDFEYIDRVLVPYKFLKKIKE